MVGAFVAATVVTLVQFLRLRDRRLLPLAAMFAFQAQALAREWYDVWRDAFQAGVCVAGLALLLSLSLWPSPVPPPRPALPAAADVPEPPPPADPAESPPPAGLPGPSPPSA